MTARAALVLLLAASAACSSWNTGSGSGDDAEQACEATLSAFARAHERCGEDYRTAYDALLRDNAAGDCKNVRTIRDERALREECIPLVDALTCEALAQGTTDPACARQLQRTASFRFEVTRSPEASSSK